MPSDSAAKTVFLFDIDNTLLDNDRVTGDLKRFLEDEVGSEQAQRYWAIFDNLRRTLGYADYLGALQQYRTECPHDMRVLKVARFLIEYPFANRLFPGSLDVLEQAASWGGVVLLTDGDVVFQPRKAERSGLAQAVEGRVLIYVHKELQLEDVSQRFPASQYVLVDDKLRILSAVKSAWGSRVQTVFVKQGHYALDPEVVQKYPPADVTIERIGDLLNMGPEALGL